MLETELPARSTVRKAALELQTNPALRDLTHLSIGAKTNDILVANPSLSASVVGFSSVSEIGADSRSLTIAIPGIVVSSQTTFENQTRLLRSLGHDVVHMDYSTSGYSADLTKAQLIDFINSQRFAGKKISLLGLSLGAGLIVDVATSAQKDELNRVDNVVLLGTVYSDEDIKKGIFGKAFRLANRFTPDVLANKAAPLAKRLFTLDPLHQDSVRSEILEIENASLIDRIKAVGKTTSIKELPPVERIRAFIGWWEDDFSSPTARENLAALFPESEVFVIPGHHSWTRTGNEAINNALMRLEDKNDLV